jgi:hypothetical protein
MTTYYVRKTGNDTTGDGSMDHPWLTVNKGITMLAAGDTLYIGDGTYAEDSGSGYLYITKALASVATIKGENGNADLVIITGASSASYDTLITCNGGKLTFEDLTFQMRTAASGSCAVRISRGSNLIFNRCKIIGLASSGLHYGLTLQESSTYVIQYITFNNCTFSLSGADTAYAVNIAANGTGTLDSITFNNCIATNLGNNMPFYCPGGTNIVINGGVYYHPTSKAVCYGKDADSSTSVVTGSINGAVIQSGASHACLVGAGCSGVTVQNCTITGGDNALVIKECANTVITNNVILEGTNNSLYFKAATGATATGNMIKNSVGGYCIRAGAGGTGNKVGNLTVQNNTVIATGSSRIFAWVDDTGDSGGCVVDANRYIPAGSYKFGAVRADSDVQNITELRAAWSGYGAGTNDVNSKLFGSSASPVGSAIH